MDRVNRLSGNWFGSVETRPAYARSPWRTSVLSRFPYTLFLALLGVLGALIGSVGVLARSHGQPIEHWTWEPSIYLAICSVLMNILLHYALSEAVRVAWWRRASQKDSSVGDLHRYWSHGFNFWSALTSGRYINLIAVACILTSIAPINVPLLQRASTVLQTSQNQTINIQGQIAQTLPNGFTGYLSGKGWTPSLMSSNFTPVVNAAAMQSPIGLWTTGCMGDCSASLRGAGFKINCSTSNVPFNLTSSYNEMTGYYNLPNVTAFSTSFNWSDKEAPGTINMQVQYKGTANGAGQIQQRNCTLQAATVEYAVNIDANKSTVTLTPGSTMFDDMNPQIINVAPAGNQGRSTYGGFVQALNDTYAGSALISNAGAGSFEISTSGPTPGRYAVIPANETANYTPDSLLSFRDPSDDVIQAIRSLMFRTSIAAADQTSTQSFPGQQTTSSATFHSDFRFFAIAATLTLLAWTAIVPIFIGWWHVGRRVTLSPIETAKAFRAPILENHDSNATVAKLVEEIGGRHVQYGAAYASGSKLDRLELNEPSFIRKPEAGEIFEGTTVPVI